MFGTRGDDDEFRETRRSSIELTRRHSSWHLASFAGLILALGSGCKSSSGGKGDDTEEDGGGGGNDSGGGTTQDSGPDGSSNGDPDTGTDSDANVDIDAQQPGDDDAGDAGGGELDAETDAAQPGDGDGGSDTDAATPPTSIADKTSIDFGLANCGGDAPASQTFTLSNTTAADVTYTVALSNSTAFSIQGATDGTKSGTIVSGATDSITLNAIAVPTTATAGAAIVATATVTTNLPSPLNQFTIPISVTPQGAHLQLSTAGSPLWLSTQVGRLAQDKTVTIQNTGNMVANVTLTPPAQTAFGLLFGGAAASTLDIAAASDTAPGSVDLTATFFPTVIGPYQDSATLAVAGATCNGGPAASIASFPLRGSASGEALTVDFVEPFENQVNCGATGTGVPKGTLSVTNNSPDPQTLTISLGAGAGSDLTLSKSAMTLAPGASETFDAELKAALATKAARPGDELGDTILVSAGAGSGLNPAQADLFTIVQGAVLTVSAPSTFALASNANPSQQQITVSNAGNVPASPTFTIGGADAARFAVTSSPSQIPNAPGGSSGTAQVQVTFTPAVGDSATKTATLVLTGSPSDVICDPQPADTNLIGTASTGGFRYVTVAEPIFQPDCPAPGASDGSSLVAAAAQTVTIQNTGNAPFDWQARVADPSRFTLSVGGTPIAATDSQNLGFISGSNTATLTITPAPLTFPVSTAEDAYGTDLFIQTTVPNDSEEHKLHIQQTAQGAILAFVGSPLTSFGKINVAAQSDQATLWEVNNTGNVSAVLNTNSVVTGPSGSHAAFLFTPNGSVYASQGNAHPSSLTLAPGATTGPITGAFAPVFTGTYNPNTDVGVSTMTNTFTSPVTRLCAALPATSQVTGEGANAVSSLSTNAIDFGASSGAQTCGGTRASRPRTVVLTNYGNEVLRIDSIALDAGGTDSFTAYINQSGTTGGVNVDGRDPETGAPGTAILVVVPKLIPSNPGVTTTVTSNLNIVTSLNGVTTTGTDALDPIALSNSVTCP